MAKSGNRMYNPGKSACGKRRRAETAGTIRARVPAERGEERKPHVQFGQEYLRKARRCGNRRYNPSEYTCGKRRRAETACTIRARVRAESEEMRKPQVQPERIHLRKARRCGNRTYNPGKSTCGKRGDAESTRTTRARVPAERGEGRKPHVQSGQECVRKARRCGNRMYNLDKSACGKRGDAEACLPGTDSFCLPTLYNGKDLSGGQPLNDNGKVHGDTGHDKYHVIGFKRQKVLRAEGKCQR